MISDLIHGYRTARDLQKKVDLRYREIERGGMWPAPGKIALEHQTDIERLYDQRGHSPWFDRGARLHAEVYFNLGPAGMYDLDWLHREIPQAVAFADEINGLLGEILQGLEEAIDEMPPTMAQNVRAEAHISQNLPGDLKYTVPYHIREKRFRGDNNAA